MSINRLYHTWFQRVEQLWPDLRKTQRRNVTWLLVGIYVSGFVHARVTRGKGTGFHKGGPRKEPSPVCVKLRHISQDTGAPHPAPVWSVCGARLPRHPEGARAAQFGQCAEKGSHIIVRVR